MSIQNNKTDSTHHAGFPAARTASGLLLLLGSAVWFILGDHQMFPGLLAALLVSWGVSVVLTCKYTHKYPQRFYSYLLASHGKAAVLMLLALGLLIFMGLSGEDIGSSAGRVIQAYLVFTLLDFLLSALLKWFGSDVGGHVAAPPPVSNAAAPEESLPEVDTGSILKQLQDHADPDICRAVKSIHIEGSKGNDLVLKLKAASQEQNPDRIQPAALVWMAEPVNHVRRLNIFLRSATHCTVMGGYFVFRYIPLEDVIDEIRRTKQGLAYYLAYSWNFLRYRAIPKLPVLEKVYFWSCFRWLDDVIYTRTHSKRRVISRAEMWGRIYYQGFKVVDERRTNNGHIVVAQRVRAPERVRKPSFFLVVGLTKVGLNGELIQLHKIRTMYPFSEFIQAKVFEDNGLSATGKFKDDFRLTDYGKFLRKYWLDEIPQIYDWLRGDIKLVGMRATSPHFLSLYPKELYDLYVQVKPGLIPPIFDATTNGFDDIVRIELDYLRSYMKNPVRTDVRCFMRTFCDIVFRGVRSK